MNINFQVKDIDVKNIQSFFRRLLNNLVCTVRQWSSLTIALTSCYSGEDFRQYFVKTG